MHSIVCWSMFYMLLFTSALHRVFASSDDFVSLSKLCGSVFDGNGPFGSVEPKLFLKQRSIGGYGQSVFQVDFDSLVSAGTAKEPRIVEEVDNFDWQKQGAVSKNIHDQGSLGTCTAFAVTGNIEGQRFLKGDGVLEGLSVEQIIECSADFDKNDDEADCGVFGGWPKLVLKYIQKRGGIASEKDWPYCAGTLNPVLVPGCFPCMPKGYSREGCDDHDDDFYCDAESTKGQNKADPWCTSANFRPRVSIKEVIVFDDTEDEEVLKKHLLEYGPLAVGLSIGPLQFYRHGIVDPPAIVCAREGRPEHVALLTGFGVEHGKPYWRLKNSWGYAWGEQGYFRLRRGKNSCGIGRFQVATASGVKVLNDNDFPHVAQS